MPAQRPDPARPRSSARRAPLRRTASALLLASALSAVPLATLPGAAVGADPAAPPAASPAASPVAAGAASATRAAVAVRARRGPLRLRVPKAVAAGSRFAVRGTVRTGAGTRRVTLRERRGNRWRTVGSSRTSRSGAFRVRVRAGAGPATRAFRVEARSGRRLLGAARFRVRVEAPAAPTTVTAAWPASTIALGTPATVTGLVTAVDAVGRTAVLQAGLPSGWRDVASVPVAADGSYALTAPGDWLSTLEMRVVVPASATSAAGVSPTSTLTVAPTWTPPGSADDWTELGADLPLRYDPCQVVRYRTNLDLAPPDAAAAIPVALQQVTLATGLRFQDVGTTTALFDGRGPHAAYPKDATLVIGFGTAAQTNAPFAGASPTVGWGGSSHGVRARSATLGPVWRIVRGGAVLRADHAWQPGPLLEALVHEVGHAVGLGHAGFPDQVMYPVSEGANTVWGAGDLTGLRSAGLQAGCLAPGAPGSRDAADRHPGVVALP